MRYNELTMEAQLTPGQVKAIKVEIGKYEEELRKLNQKKNSLDDQFMFGAHPDDPVLADKIQKYIDAYTAAIDKMKAELAGKNDNKGFGNLIAGIKKNCSEALAIYKKYDTFLYAGFKNAKDHSALYAKSPSQIVVPEFYNTRNFAEIADLIQDFYDFGNFNDAILASTYSPNANSDGREAFIIFPVNGFKYFYTRGKTQLNIRTNDIPELFDKDELRRGWKTFVEDQNILRKFVAAGAKIGDTGKDAVGWYEGFMGMDNYQTHLTAIDTLVENGDVDQDWMYYSSWTKWVTKESFEKSFKMGNTSLEDAAYNGNDVVVNTKAVYAISVKYKRQVQQMLGMGMY